MKKISVICLMVLIAFSAFTQAQAPVEGINYQAIARDQDGKEIPDQPIGVQFTIEDLSGNILYQETHTPTTNAYGLFSLVIGTGTPQGGSLPGDLLQIDWLAGETFLDVAIDEAGGTSYVSLGRSRFQAVPYALSAPGGFFVQGTAGQILRHNGTVWDSTSALYSDPTTGNLGIGTNLPQNKLHVMGIINASNGYLINGTANSGTYLRGNGATYSSSVILNSDLPSGPASWTKTGNNLYPVVTDNIGVGTTTPAYKVDVSGIVRSSGGFLDGSGTPPAGNVLRSNGTSFVSSPVLNSDLPLGPASWNKTGNSLYPAITDNLGIGTTTPAYKVDVAGTIRSSGGYLDGSGTPPAGHYLRSDGTSFISSPILAGDLPATAWTKTGTNIHPTTLTDRVGIGLSNPGAPLAISHTLTTSANAMESYLSAGAASGTSSAVRGGATGTAAGQAVGGYFSALGQGTGTTTGVLAQASGTGSGAKRAVEASAISNSGVKMALFANANGSGTNYGVYASATGGTDNYSGYFQSGNVFISDFLGIGSQTPQYPLHVYGPTTANTVMQLEGNNTTSAGMYVNASNFSAYPFYGYKKQGTAGVYHYQNATNDWVLNNNGDHLLINSLGNVGIGSLLPTSKLEVKVLNTYYGVGSGAVKIFAGTGGSSVGLYTLVTTNGDSSSYRYGFAKIGGYQPVPTNSGGYNDFGGWFHAYGGGTWGLIASNSNAQTANPETSTNYAALASGTYAGYFNGLVQVNGTLSKSGGTFKIDHPLDPANKFLVHSFVESPDMMNVYNGNTTTDANGYATVTLPSYFEAENKDFKYQLTVIGVFAQAIVQEEISNNTFVIRTDQPNVKVSWQITGVRNDRWAQENRFVPEVDKKDHERGRYLHPELFGAPPTQAISPSDPNAPVRR